MRRWRTLALTLIAAGLSVGCQNGSVTPETKPPPNPVDEIPPNVRKLIPRAESKLAYGLEEAGQGYRQQLRSWGINQDQQNEALRKALDPHISTIRVVDAWVGQIQQVAHRELKTDHATVPIVEVMLRFPALLLERHPVVVKGENYDRDSGYATLSEEQVDGLKPGTWVRFSGVIQPDSEAHWEGGVEGGEMSPVCLATMTLTGLEKIK